MKYIKLTVTYLIDEREQEALNELLVHWNRYKEERGVEPDTTIENLFDAIMTTGCKHDISKKIKQHQYRYGLITMEERLDEEGFRTAAERSNDERT